MQNHELRISVIPTCANLKLFTPYLPKKKNNHFILGYVGSVGTWYLFDEVLACFQELRRIRADSQLLIVNRADHVYIRDRLLDLDIPENSVILKSANHNEIPALMAKMDAGIFFIKPVFSKQASAPTKLAEFLGCGLPCLSNAGVGDMSQLLEGENIGVAINSFESGDLQLGVEKILDLAADLTASKRCVAVAQKYFSLTMGVDQYKKIYVDLMN
jgi:glycosyltransferase involved in cell wall biosynthesis